MATEKSSEGEEKPAKGGLGLIGLLALGAAALAGSFGVIFLTSKPLPQIAAAASCPPGSAGEQAIQTASRKDQRYFEMDELLITIGSAPADRYLKLNAVIITDADGLDTVKKAQPLLMDAFNFYLRSVELQDFEDPAFYAHLREQLGLRAELVLGLKDFQGVLITDFLLR